ncbi:hypothetical protein OH76DRAFT_630776 [Lentinus brumalis]|uniref:Uncharacterized protein n=1 Tax=Lentinus brumalis TaxID=2498619 RepID=A0A371D8F7_9APHY|nr:hypothetical protein OH76DRAFT_630776 [Polyporus brumalis]
MHIAGREGRLGGLFPHITASVLMVDRRQNSEMSTHARSSGYRHTPARESKPTGTWRRAIPSSVSLEGAGAGRGSGSRSDDTEQLEAALRTPRRHKIDALYVWHGLSPDSVLRLRGVQRTREPRLWPAPLPSTQPAPPSADSSLLQRPDSARPGGCASPNAAG